MPPLSDAAAAVGSRDGTSARVLVLFASAVALAASAAAATLPVAVVVAATCAVALTGGLSLLPHAMAQPSRGARIALLALHAVLALLALAVYSAWPAAGPTAFFAVLAGPPIVAAFADARRRPSGRLQVSQSAVIAIGVVTGCGTMVAPGAHLVIVLVAAWAAAYGVSLLRSSPE